jgi:hypothetical protein
MLLMAPNCWWAPLHLGLLLLLLPRYLRPHPSRLHRPSRCWLEAAVLLSCRWRLVLRWRKGLGHPTQSQRQVRGCPPRSPLLLRGHHGRAHGCSGVCVVMEKCDRKA